MAQDPGIGRSTGVWPKRTWPESVKFGIDAKPWAIAQPSGIRFRLDLVDDAIRLEIHRDDIPDGGEEMVFSFRKEAGGLFTLDFLDGVSDDVFETYRMRMIDSGRL